ncbi:MAG TPA: response regulator transcription factor [Candidatus Baltobacteraceae bacterium]|nr:response regulator transcription factor [Candidatus Baltobacteraceae bacterium]
MRVLLVDDQGEYRASLRDLLSSLDDIEVVGEAADGTEAIAAAIALEPDITLMDIRMPVMDGISATATICSRVPNARILVLTTFDEDELVRKAMRAGAAGYLLKGTPLEDMISIFRLALGGYRGIRPRGNSEVQLDDEASALARDFSDRERQVWALLGEGATNREIAERLFLSEGTVKNYITSILATLGLRHRTQAALLWRALHPSTSSG